MTCFHMKAISVITLKKGTFITIKASGFDRVILFFINVSLVMLLASHGSAKNEGVFIPAGYLISERDRFYFPIFPFF